MVSPSHIRFWSPINDKSFPTSMVSSLPHQWAVIPHIINHSLPHHQLVPLHQQSVLSLIIRMSTHIIGQSSIIYNQSFPTSSVGPLTSSTTPHQRSVNPHLWSVLCHINGLSFPHCLGSLTWIKKSSLHRDCYSSQIYAKTD